MDTETSTSVKRKTGRNSLPFNEMKMGIALPSISPANLDLINLFLMVVLCSEFVVLFGKIRRWKFNKEKFLGRI